MTDLRKAAQDLIESVDSLYMPNDVRIVDMECIEALRQALQAEPEPVAWLFQHEETGQTDYVDAQQIEWGFEENNPSWQKIQPIYAHPSSIDALIAEIDELALPPVSKEKIRFITDKYRRAE